MVHQAFLGARAKIANQNGHPVTQVAQKPFSIKSGFALAAGALAGLFVTLFLFRLCYLYFLAPMVNKPNVGASFFDGIDNLPKNYASVNSLPGGEGQPAGGKFEKIAYVKSITPAIEKEEAIFLAAVSRFGCVIQYEKKSGIRYNRVSHFLVAVRPANFDSFYTVVQRLGEPAGKEMSNIDKTNEYRALLEKKSALQQTLFSLSGLKGDGRQGFVRDLQNEIDKMEASAQKVEADLANFHSGNDFCTVRLSLYETTMNDNEGSVTSLKGAFHWAVKTYPLALLILLAVVIFKVAERMKISELFPPKPKH